MPVYLALAAGLGAGVLLGASAARRAGASCVRDLGSGDGVELHGLAGESSVQGVARRLTLFGVSIRPVGSAHRCSVSRLVVRLDTIPSPVRAGARVTVQGEWVRIGRPSAWPRRPGRRGIVVGRLDEPGGREDRLLAPAAAAPTRVLRAARARASDRLRRLLPPDVSPVARALVLAERDDLPGSLRTRFAEAGLAHLLAISGLHVGLIGSAIGLLLRSFAGPKRAAVGAAAVVAVYVAAIGAPPSAVRASLLLAGWAVARIRGLPARAWDLLGVAALVALVKDPLVLVEPGFQLSFAGFSGLGAGAAVWQGCTGGRAGNGRRADGPLHRLPRGARRRLKLIGLAMAGGTGAFMATAPIAAAHFQHVAPAALISHFAGTPLVGGAIGSLAMTLVLPPPLDTLSAGAATTIIRFMVSLADWIAGLPGAHGAVVAPSPATWAALLLLLASLGRWLRWGRLRTAVLPLAGAAALIVAAPSLYTRVPGGLSLICSLDVGQGDAAVLRTARGRWILFDAGPSFGTRDAGRDVVLPLLRRYGARRIDLFVLSHPDLDHAGGFEAIHESVPVFRVLDSGHPIPKPSYARFLARTEDDGIRWLRAREGDAVYLDNVTIRVLGPPPLGPESGGHGLANETSLLLRVSIGRALVYLNTGDATAAAERALLTAWGADSLRADLLKVGHHGSKGSSAAEFLSAVRPSTAIISAGRGNAYGHPHPSVLDRLSRAGVPRVWRTDRDGTLCIEVDDDRGWRVQGESEWTRSPERGTRLDVIKG
ncbi:MAG: DNA internalization-related competence protein ComEC/Rec2 [marine benthic group bacterium]|nr:DNA internalization-related competence protein ComEC/Rec2 [Gemmatimonadota bacterium]